MASIMRSLLTRTSSTAIPSNGSGAESPKAPQPSSPSTLTSSPSFNDFASSVDVYEAEHDNPFAEMPARGVSFDVPSLMRGSMDSITGTRESMEGVQPSRASTSSRFASWGAGTIFGRSAAINIPASSKPSAHHDPAPEASAPAAAPTTPRRKGTGKIAGLDYYEFCELIRSSSL